jgi:hypothetical protein
MLGHTVYLTVRNDSGVAAHFVKIGYLLISKVAIGCSNKMNLSHYHR